MEDRIVIAVGGNALAPDSERGTGAHQKLAAASVARSIATLIGNGRSVAITHGNGPQVGDELLRAEIASGTLDPPSLDTLVAGTQGTIGYLLQQALHDELAASGATVPVISVITQVEVDPEDPAWDRPSKPVGGVIPESAVAERRANGWTIALDPGRGWRRVVPSPRPVSIVEAAAIRTVVDAGVIVICGGGGGIPVVRRGGVLEGVAAVVDKDSVAAMVAGAIGAETLAFATSVEGVALRFGHLDEEWLSTMTVAEADGYLESEHFGRGSMEPKIRASLAFLRGGGGKVVISTPERLADALEGRAGTTIVP